MTSSYLFAYQDAMMRTTKDIHDRCATEVSVLWDDGKFGPARGPPSDEWRGERPTGIFVRTD